MEAFGPYRPWNPGSGDHYRNDDFNLGKLFLAKSLAKELAAFCEVAGADFDRVRLSANTDGEANLPLPGIGVGGYCVPVYPYFLTRESRRLDITQRISEAAREINDQQPGRELDRLAAV